ncbi:hypothetical protein DRF59_08795 [Chryseobacterium flavum]|uniref:Uncharacterized protein n=1 Tax=Chryseobacterium flavum TaxID=415851 RepID=A0A3D9CMT3_9FLAO|nr:hypothetical protein [Chryseobacterium flavum]REC67052.1 hypothetical protein DRF59_08795 [Chryseobacterium flavum]
MRLTYLTFLFAFFGLLLNCNNTKLKESEPQKAVKQTEIKEIFSLVKPVNKPEEPLYTTLYNGYSISIQSDSSHQELIFKKGNVEIKKTLKFYYENPEIVFHLYKSDLDNIIILIEGRDYYGSNLGVYYIGSKTNKIIEIDDSLNYTQDNPETKGFKFPKAEIIKKDDELKCKFFLGNKLLSDKTYDIPTIEKTSSSKKDIIADANQSTTPSDLKGTWAVICENELTELEINKNEGYLSLYDFNAIYINLKVEKVSNKNEYLLKYASLASQQDYYKENLKIIDEEISKDKVIGKLILQKNGKAELQWTGLYNMKKQKLEFVGNDFLLIKENGGKTPLILEPCK